MCIFYVGANMAHPYTPTMFKNLNMPDYMFGVALACMSVMGFLMAPFWGRLSDYVGRVKILAIGCFGYAVGQMMFCYATTIGGIVFGRLFSGVFCNSCMVCTMAYVTDTSEGGERAQNLAMMVALSSVFSAAGYLFGGVIGDLSITVAFYVQSGLLVLCGFLLCTMVEEKREVVTGINVRGLVKESNPFSAFIKSKSIMNVTMVLFLASVCASSLGTTCFDTAFNYYIKAEFNFPATYNGLIKAGVGIIGLAANFTINMWMVRHTDTRKSIIGVLAGCVVSICLVLSAKTISYFIIMGIVYYTFNTIYLPIQQALAMREADENDTGIISGLFSSIRSVGMVIGSLMAGFAYTWGSKVPFILSAAVFAAAVIISALNYAQERRNQLKPTGKTVI